MREKTRRWEPRRSPLVAVLLSTWVLLVLPSRADAYLDPGTGSYLFQMVVAALISVAFVLRSYWASLRDGIARRLRRRSVRDTEPD